MTAGRICNAVCFFFVCGVLTSATAQQLLKPGPLGRPLAVMDEAGNWSVPISVYSDNDVELLIPDITQPAWAQWHATEYREHGSYVISMFSYYKNDHLCRKNRIPQGHSSDPIWLQACAELRYQRRILKIDIQHQTVTLLDAILLEADAQYHPLNQVTKTGSWPLSSADPQIAYSRIQKIVNGAIANLNGMTAEEILQHNRQVQSDIAKKMMSPDNKQGCPNVTAEQLANWHSVGCPPPSKAQSH